MASVTFPELAAAFLTKPASPSILASFVEMPVVKAVKSQYGDFAGLVWVDGSYVLFVEPRLIGNFDIVSVRVADVCREVIGTPFGPKAWFLD